MRILESRDLSISTHRLRERGNRWGIYSGRGRISAVDLPKKLARRRDKGDFPSHVPTRVIWLVSERYGPYVVLYLGNGGFSLPLLYK